MLQGFRLPDRPKSGGAPLLFLTDPHQVKEGIAPAVGHEAGCIVTDTWRSNRRMGGDEGMLAAGGVECGGVVAFGVHASLCYFLHWRVQWTVKLFLRPR